MRCLFMINRIDFCRGAACVRLNVCIQWDWVKRSYVMMRRTMERAAISIFVEFATGTTAIKESRNTKVPGLACCFQQPHRLWLNLNNAMIKRTNTLRTWSTRYWSKITNNVSQGSLEMVGCIEGFPNRCPLQLTFLIPVGNGCSCRRIKARDTPDISHCERLREAWNLILPGI